MCALSSNLTAHFTEPHEQPDAAMAHWRTNRPAWLPDHYREIDNSYNSVTWEWRHIQWFMRFIPFAGFFGGATCYRITALFESDGAFGSSITVNGQADLKTQEAISSAAQQYEPGGAI